MKVAKLRQYWLGCVIVMFMRDGSQAGDYFRKISLIAHLNKGISEGVGCRIHAVNTVSFPKRVEGPVTCHEGRMKMCVRRIIFHDAGNHEVEIHSLSVVDDLFPDRLFIPKVFVSCALIDDHFTRIVEYNLWVCPTNHRQTEDVGIGSIYPKELTLLEKQILLFILHSAWESEFRKTCECFDPGYRSEQLVYPV